MNTSTHNESNTDSTLQNVAQQCSAITESTKQCVEEKPLTYTMVTLGAGFAIGLAIASVIGGNESNQRNRFADQISNSVVNGLSSWMPSSFRS